MQEEAESEGEELEDSLPSSAAVEIFSRCQNLHLSAQEFMTRIEELVSGASGCGLGHGTRQVWRGGMANRKWLNVF